MNDADAAQGPEFVPEGGAWTMTEVEPTNLIVLWAGHEAPTMVEVTSLIGSVIEGEVAQVDEIESDDPDIRWSTVIRIGERETPVILWCESFKPESVEDEEIDVSDVRWVIGFETLLNPDDPIADFSALLRMVTRAFDDSPAALDVNTARWLPRRVLHGFFAESELDPPADLLWIIHGVQSGGGPHGDHDDSESGGVWLHTHGLWRCGMAELEMLDVPPEYAEEAGGLINAIAELAFENDLPEPGDRFSPGPDIELALQPWEVAAKYLAEGTPGRAVDREHDDPHFTAAHGGVRAVICDPKPRGEYRKIWTWPRDALERLRAGEAVLFSSMRATMRQADLAQSNWPELAMAFATLCSRESEAEEKRVKFLIKAGFTAADTANGSDDGAATFAQPQPGTFLTDHEEREHMWFEIDTVRGDRARGVLLNDPMYIRAIKMGDRVWVDRARTTDWTVLTAEGSFSPEEVGPLRDVVERLRTG